MHEVLAGYNFLPFFPTIFWAILRTLQNSVISEGNKVRTKQT